MTGDIPPALLLNYICTSLETNIREPKQQRWQMARVEKNALGLPILVWSPASGLAPTQHSLQQCRVAEMDGAEHQYWFTQGVDGTVYWAEVPEE